MPIVDMLSATPDIVTHPLSLDRPHILINKFSGPDDPQYKRVVDTIRDLLEKIFDERHITKADSFIRNECYSLRNLEIQRLTGESLPMDQCYINLATVKNRIKNESRAQKADATERTSQNRLKLELPGDEELVTLPHLFAAREMEGGQRKIPKRILIRGQAGVGKTTFCKKIVYEFVYGKLWQSIFDHVLWVPLRNLKLQERRNIAGYNMLNLFHHEYFSQHREGKKLADFLWEAINMHKTLFILDGLDETSGLDGSVVEFLKHLLNQQNVIITSRANAILPTGLHPLDLELETIGFGSEEVGRYIKNAFTNRETDDCDQVKVEKVQKFLRDHHVLQDLVRIPIQLDAFCLTWDDHFTKHIPETMTAVYDAIECRLWKKDVVNLGKGHTSQDLRITRRVDRYIEKERELIEALAFTGMVNDIISFEAEHRDVVADSLGLPAQYTSLDDLLGKVSFLRTSDPVMERDDKTYHFLHLTFQEYFAARYFVRYWRDSKLLKCLAPKHAKCVDLKPAAFLGKFKYDVRYGVFWRFVAGLIGAEDDKQKIDFFRMIEAEPRDLLGPSHQRLVMHCLSEVPPKRQPGGFTKLREGLEGHLSQWLRFEYEFMEGSQLVCESDVPETSLKMALQQANQTTKMALLKSLQNMPRIPLCVLDLEASWVAGDDSVRQILDIIGLLQRAGQPVFNEMVTAVAGLLKNEDSSVRQAAVSALGKQPSLSEAVLQAVVQKLEDEYYSVRRDAIFAFGKQPSLSEAVLQAVVQKLEDEDFSVRQAAIDALGKQPSLSKAILQAVIQKLEHEKFRVRLAAIDALETRPSLSEAVLQTVVQKLKDEDSSLREAAIFALRKQLSLSEAMLQAVVQKLEHENYRVRQAAISALETQPSLSGAVLQAVVQKLEDIISSVRLAAISAFGKQPSLSGAVLQAVVQRLEDKDSSVRYPAVLAFGKQSSLSETILQAVVQRLEDKDYSVRFPATDALRKQLSISEAVLQTIVQKLEHEDYSVRWAAIDTLGKQRSLSEAMLQAVVQKLEDENFLVRRAAIDALTRRPSLSEAVLQAVVQKLEDEYYSVRRDAIFALGKQPSLSEAVLQVVSKNLKQVVLDTAGYRSVVFMSLLRHNPRLILLSDACGTFEHLFHFLLQQSFYRHLVWYYNAGMLYLHIDGIVLEHKAQIPFSAFDRASNVRSVPVLATSS